MEKALEGCEFIHIGILVSNLDKTLQQFESMPGFKFVNRDNGAAPPEEIFKEGIPFKMNMGSVEVGNITYEIIEPLNDCYFSECLKDKGDHMHHACYRVGKNFDYVLEELLKRGGIVKIMIQGSVEDKSAFVEMPGKGIVFEIIS